MRADGNFGGDAQEILAGLASVVGYAANYALLIDQVVRKRRDRAHMDSAEHQDASLSQCGQRCGNDFSRRRENDGGVEFCGRLGERSPSPFGAEFEREFLVARISGRRVHVYIPMPRYLNTHVSRCTESVKAKFASGLDSREPKTTKPDDACAQEWRRLLIGKLARNRVDKILGSHNVLGIAAVHGVTGEGRIVTKVFRSSVTILASAIGVMEPGNSDAFANLAFL